MATNPMQKRSRISFILGMLVMLIISALVVAFLYLKIKNQETEIQKYKTASSLVYVLNQNVKSGQVLTEGMFTQQQVTRTAIPTNATNDIVTTLSSYSLATKDGIPIYYNPGTSGNSEDSSYYYVGNASDKKPIYRMDEQGNESYALYLKASDKAYYYTDANKTQKKEIEVSENAVIAKVDMNANTVLTSSLVSRTDEVTSNDLRREEYNVISLPVDLEPGEYIDVRLLLPNGQNYIVVSKKKVKIPVVDGLYVSDTIQINLTEEEIMVMSGAIVECFKTKGSKLYATRYTEAGMQEAATMTYYPSKEVQSAIQNDPNVVIKSIQGILKNREQIRKDIDSATSGHESEEDLSNKMETGITSTLEERKNYLQTLPVTQ